MLFNAAVVACVATLVVAQPPLREFNKTETASFGFIVELEPGATFKRNDDTHAHFHKRAQDIVPNYEVRYEFKNQAVFYGVSINAPNNTDVNGLLALPEVKAIWRNRYHERPEPFGAVDSMIISSSSSSATSTQAKNTRDVAKVIHVNGTSDVNAPLKMTNVDKVHALGFKGKGIKIGILDTGVDYRHPALGGGFGPGFKVAGGVDLVGDAYTGANKPQPDDDPLTSCLSGGHGTHVAGIIGAEDPEGVGFGVRGVAPEATLYAYRILGCAGGVTDDVILAGFQAAAEDGVNLISMSVGATAPWETDSPFQSAFAALKKQGIGMVVAAGNSGTGGPYYASWPALDPSIIGVGSVQSVNFPVAYTALDSAKAEVEYVRLAPMDGSKGEWLVFDPSAKGSFGCDQQSWSDAVARWDPSRIIAFMDASSTCTQSVAYYAERTGIQHVWLAVPDDTDLSLQPPLEGAVPAVTYLRATHGDKLAKGIESMGWNYTISFSDASVHHVSQPSGGAMSYYSSFGPTIEMSLKPQISAPGGTVLSTWPTSDGFGYAVLSGTSMATPHMAGAYALLLQALPGTTPDEALARLQSTAKPLPLLSQKEILVTTGQQGGGMIDVLSAIQADTFISPTQFNLRDSAASISKTITIENRSKEPKTYKIAHQGGSYVNASPNLRTDSASSYGKFDWVENNAATYATVSFSSSSVTVAAGASANVVATITPPEGGDPDLHPLYSGFVTISDAAATDSTYSLPYIGLPYARNSTATLDLIGLWTPSTKPSPPAGIPLSPYVKSISYNKRNNDLMTFTFPAWAPPPDSDEDQDDDDDLSLAVVLRQPSAYMRIDAVSPFYRRGGAYRPTALGFDPCAARKLDITAPPAQEVEEFDGVSSYGMVYSLVGGGEAFPSARFQESMGLGYGVYTFIWQWAEVEAPNGTLIQLPNGDYRLLVRVLKAGLTDWKMPAGQEGTSWESWLSPVVRVNISDPGYPNPYDKYNKS